MKSLLLVLSFVLSTTAIADEGSVLIQGETTNEMIFKILESLKEEGNKSVYEREEGDARILQLAAEAGTLTCQESEGMKNGEPVERVVTCDVNID